MGIFRGVAGVGVAVSMSACGLAPGTSPIQRGYYQARQGSQALVPLIAVTGKSVDGNAETYLLIRENYGRGASVSVLSSGLGIHPTEYSTAGSEERYRAKNAPFIEFPALESEGIDRPLLRVTLEATEGSAENKFTLEYEPVSAREFALEAMTDERLSVASTLKQLQSCPDCEGSRYELQDFCIEFGWGTKCERLSAEVKL